MTRCTCTVFSRNWKLHSRDCAMRQAYEKREDPTAPIERKAGKRGRIKAMVKVLRPDQEPVFDEQLMVVLGMKKEKK